MTHHITDEQIYDEWARQCQATGITTRTLVCNFARAVLALAASQGEPVYLITHTFTDDPEGTWRIASRDAYDIHPAKWRRVLYTAPAPAVPSGWKLVPVEPTPDMKSAGIKVEVYSEVSDSIGALTWVEVRAIYRAMLTAAPTPPAQQVSASAAMQSDPVAWMLPRDGDDCAVFREHQDYPFAERGWTPLYTKTPAVPESADGAMPMQLGELAKRNIYDAIRGAYDLGYNDARNARAVPGDSAPGYKGRNVEADHGGALLQSLNQRLRSAATEPAVPEDVVRDAKRYRWLRDMASQDWLHRNHNYQNLRGAAFDAAIDAARAAEKGGA